MDQEKHTMDNWAQDLYSVNERFGNTSDLRALSDALHARGMLLMVDVAPNHMGSGPSPTFPIGITSPGATPITSTPRTLISLMSRLIKRRSRLVGLVGRTVLRCRMSITELPEVVATLYLWI
jgi:hypothetical protein